MRLSFLYVAMLSTMLSFCNDKTKFNETPSPLFMGHGISVKKASLVARPINVYVDKSFSHEVPICDTDDTSDEGMLDQSFSDILYHGAGLLLLSDYSLYHHRELVSISNNTNYTASYVHATVISLFAGSYVLCWFFTWDTNRNHRLIPLDYKIRVLNSYYGVVSFSVLVWIQKVIGTPTNVKDHAWWIELICWVVYVIVLLMAFLIHNPITDSGLLDIAIGIGSSCFIFNSISKWSAVPFYTVVCFLIFIRNHFEDIRRVVRPIPLKSPSSKGLPRSVVDVEEHSNRLPPLSPLRAGLSYNNPLPPLSPLGAGLTESSVDNSHLRPWSNQQENNSLLPPSINQQERNIDLPAIDEQGIDRPLPEITEQEIAAQVIHPQNGDQGIDRQENDVPQNDDQEEIGDPVMHPQVINPPSLGSRSNACNQVAEMEIEDGDSLRLLFAEEGAEMEIEYGDNIRLLIAEEVVVHTLIFTLYAILILAAHIHNHTR